MTIKDIAELAGVSTSTVSKIMNGKSDDISQETSDKVLKIAKEYNYAPYASVKTRNKSRSFILGILLPKGSLYLNSLSGILDVAHLYGYAPIICTCENTKEELKNITTIIAHGVDGVLWDRIDINNGNERHLNSIPFLTLNSEYPPSDYNYNLDYEHFGFECAKALVERKHKNIACLIPNRSYSSRKFQEGYQRNLRENNIYVDNQLCKVWDNATEKDFTSLEMKGVTGIICFGSKLASDIYMFARRKNISIPRDLSVLCLNWEQAETGFDPPLSTILFPMHHFGRYCSKKLISVIENREITEDFKLDYHITTDASIDIPITIRNKKIVVVGAMNIDTLIHVDHFPRLGESTSAKNYAIIPGGRGVNQAIGAARLGAEVYLLGRIGKDFGRNAIFEALHANSIDVRSIKNDSYLATGQAFIYVKEDGENISAVYQGANVNFLPDDILAESHVFMNASFCLLQTGINEKTVECAAEIAHKNGAKVILKPAVISSISDSLLSKVDIFIPNLNEAHTLCPLDISLEDKAQYFLDKGVGTVIITLAQNGCYLRNNELSKYFAAAEFQSVDATGASDAFAATLAVFLSENYDLETSINYATYAAGFSTTRQGVPPSLVDRGTLELIVKQK